MSNKSLHMLVIGSLSVLNLISAYIIHDLNERLGRQASMISLLMQHTDGPVSWVGKDGVTNSIVEDSIMVAAGDTNVYRYVQGHWVTNGVDHMAFDWKGPGVIHHSPTQMVSWVDDDWSPTGLFRSSISTVSWVENGLAHDITNMPAPSSNLAQLHVCNWNEPSMMTVRTVPDRETWICMVNVPKPTDPIKFVTWELITGKAVGKITVPPEINWGTNGMVILPNCTNLYWLTSVNGKVYGQSLQEVPQ